MCNVGENMTCALFGIPTPLSYLLYHGIRVLEEKNAGEFDGQPS